MTPDQWLVWERQAASVSWGGMAAAALLWDYKRLRHFWLTELSRSVERYVRSPVFIETMGANLRVLGKVAAPARGGSQ
jgi:hypothetical protein